MSPETLSLVTTIAGLTGVSLATFLTGYSFSLAGSSGSKSYELINFNDEGLYEDQDGTATKESQDAYSVRLPRVLTSICALLAVLISVTNIVWSELKSEELPVISRWLFLGGWVRLV